MPWIDTGRTRTGRAFNGHLMVYRVLELEENGRMTGETKTSQWDAWCAPDCRACAGGESLPDW